MNHPNSKNSTGFVHDFSVLFGSVLERFEVLQEPGRGRRPKLAAWKLLASMVYHVMAGAGYLSAHVHQIFGVNIADSSLSERRQRIGLEPFVWLMKHGLRVLADGRVHKASFYKGLRLCGIDGSKWSVTNTPQVLEKMKKSTSRRLQAAFAKIEMCALVELGMHNPLAAEVGLKGEGEWNLASRLLTKLPKRSLLIVDRLYGCGKYLRELVKSCTDRDSELLVRARSSNKARVIKKLSDGSAIVVIGERAARRKGASRGGKKGVKVREIRARIRKPGAKAWSDVRLWTTLLDEKAHPAQKLLELYGMRWEQEIFYKELKLQVRGGDVLRSHTPETAAQEVAALLMACSIIAEQRGEAARTGRLNPLRISFSKTLDKLNALWTIVAMSDGLLDEAGVAELITRVRAQLVHEALPERRQRSCPRAVRKPVGSWRRLTRNESHEGPLTIEVIDIS